MTLTAAPRLAVVTTVGKGLAVVTLHAIPAGERVVTGRPITTAPQRTTTSFQVDWNRHVELDAPAWLLNHSCEPNTGVQENNQGGYDFITLRDIDPHEEITWDYDTTEYDSISVIRCLCRAPHCRGRTRGYRYLKHNPDWEPRYVAAYLRRP